MEVLLVSVREEGEHPLICAVDGWGSGAFEYVCIRGREDLFLPQLPCGAEKIVPAIPLSATEGRHVSLLGVSTLHETGLYFRYHSGKS